ncbi:lysyl oxidase family protein [Archangium lipolyticum]|uniref:lysyl oxidase family protein n=1 Tax=Archangium lipolyticum TaxID=2970465 RepID=UPI00214A824F|nr:lysyl oxidase family protein [Archangium lipolyticum]
MRMRRVLISLTLVAMWGGCRPQEPEPPPDPSPGEAPVLSEKPLWTIEVPGPLRQSCFGHSIALGDVNGDGTWDLVVAAPPCTGMTGKGHLVLYAGEGASFSSEPVVAELDWRNPNPFANGRGGVVSIGDVNGDRFADILVRAQSAGTLVFAGGEELRAVLQEPLFRVPFLGIHVSGFLSDLDGDGLDDLVVTQGAGRVTYILRATPGAQEPFTQVRVFQELAARVIPAGDLNGDGRGELLRVTAEGSELFPGCGPDAPGVCEGGVSASRVWNAPEDVTAFFPDQDGDGHPEVLLSGAGRVQVHLFQPEGGVSPAPIWNLLGDAVFPGFGGAAMFAGDLDGDGQRTEFLLGSMGRLYAFFPQKALSAELRPAWAWPRSDSLGPGFPGYVRYAVVGAGDLNGDGYADLLAGLAPPQDQLAPTQATQPGRVVAFGGGRVPSGPSAPFLKEPRSCGLSSEGKPDVTVDADVLARTLYVEPRSFSEQSCEVTERCVGAPGNRRLLRFGVSIQNLGSGAVHIPSPEQRPDLYEFDACHQHHHLSGFASYELLDARSEVVAVGRKQGFFLVDLTPSCGDATPQAIREDESQGISPGWADVYSADYPCQWLDITDIPDGTYTLRVGVNKSGIVDELDVWPDSVDVKVKLSATSVEVLP